jgi:broad specificity phosphatase PhoE
MERFGIDQHRTMYLRDAEQQFGRSYLEVFPFTEGRGAVRDRLGVYHIDSEGRQVYRERYRRAFPYHDGKSAVEGDIGMFHIDLLGNPLYTRTYGWVSDFHEGLCAARFRNGIYTYINEKGEPSDETFRYCSDFSNGIAVALDDAGFHHIGKDLEPLYEERFRLCLDFDGGRSPVMDDAGWHLIDIQGKRLTEDFDRIDGGRNGLIMGLKGNSYGYFDEECVWHRLFDFPETASHDEIPQWTKDIHSFQWDSCVVFMRHSERRSHFLSNNKGIGGTGLTAHGDELARRIGAGIADLKWKTVHARTSSSRRCVTTANCMLGAMGVPSDIEIRDEIGPIGTAFTYSMDYTEEELKCPSTIWCINQLRSGQNHCWHSNDEIKRRVFDMVRGWLDEDDSLTLCVNHDLYTIPVIGIFTGRFAEDDWIEYCDGLLFIKRENKYYVVWRGKEYPINPDAKVSIDTSPMPSDVTVDLGPAEAPMQWYLVDPHDIAWVGKPSGSMYAMCDKRGRFFHCRNDGFPVYSYSFDYVWDFSDQSAPVYKKGIGTTFVTDFGDYLHNRWFIEAREYSEGQAPVRDSKGWHYADCDGNVIQEDPFDLCTVIHHGESLVLKDGSPFIRTTDCNLRAL